MRFKKTFIPIVLLFASCSEGEGEIEYDDEQIIPKQELIPLIVDLQVLQEHYHNLFVRPDAYKDALDSASTFVFQDHGVSKEDFDRSLQFYAQRTDTLFAIYEAALDTVNFRINATSQMK